jgi:DNA-binding MarR family transcriptional regulator
VRHILPRRQRSLHLTGEGNALLAEMLPRVEAMYARILDPLSPPEQAELLRLLGKLTATEHPSPPSLD